MSADDDDNRPEVAIVAAFALTLLSAVGFAVTYVFGGQTQLLGTCLALAFAGLAVGLTVWARHLLPSGGFVEEHHGFASADEDVDRLAARLTAVSRPHRRGIVAALGLALAGLGAALVFPIRSLMQPKGVNPQYQLAHTAWRGGGVRLVDAQHQPVRLTDVEEDTIVTVFPEGHTSAGDVPSFVVRIRPRRFTSPPPAGHIDGVVAYSKLCTHAGCPVSLYEQSTGQMLCPCHQSVFDLLAGARPVAGPAARSLPGLPIAADDDGYLYATGDFTNPPGAGYWSLP